MRKIKGCWFREFKKTKINKKPTNQKAAAAIATIQTAIQRFHHCHLAPGLSGCFANNKINKHVGWALGWLILAFPIVKGLKVLNWSVWVKKRGINFQSLHHILPEQAASYQLGRGKSVHKGENLKNHQNYQCHSVVNFCNQYRYSCHFSSFFNFYPFSISQGNENFNAGSNHTKSHPECLSLAHSLVCGTFAVCVY